MRAVRNERGMSLAEVLVSLAIVSMVVVFSARLVSVAHRGTRDNINKQFATQKAMSMLEELRALIQTQDGATTVVLDAFDDGTTNQTVLTTQRAITDPGDPASGNKRVAGRWFFARRITVQRVPGATDLRLVNVKVFVNEPEGVRLLAEVASVLSTVGQASPPTQVYDVYLVAIENIPGWWVHMQNVVPFVESAMNDLEARHPGLKFRRHWIRKLSYGRDAMYTPSVNRSVDSTAPIDSVYFYPGTLPTGSAVQSYYPPDFFSARVSIDGAVANDFDVTRNPSPYALADQWNHAMRYPDELRIFNERVAAGTERADSPTLRLLLDDMFMRPSLYRNAIVVNLHGELLPFPPVRNYSDPAKDPANRPYVRAVTHPERLRYGSNTAVRLRVYTYHTAPANPGAVANWSDRPISVVIRGLNWLPPANAVRSITGGVDFDNDGNPDPYSDVVATTAFAPPSAPTNPWWSGSVVAGDTVIRLYNSPLKSPCVMQTSPCDRGGLSPNHRLYGLEYIPSPVEDLPDPASSAPFTTTLASGGDVPKNTARWIITIPSSAIPNDRMLTIETRIGDDLSTGTLWPAPNAPANVSRTYAWRGSDAWMFGDASTEPNLPMSERFQILGDPRHSPYADLKLSHAGSGLTRNDPLGMGYNRYFDDFHDAGANAASTWPGYSYDAPDLSLNWYGVKNNSTESLRGDDGWDTRSGMLELDVSRVFQVLRSAIIRSQAVYTTLTGFSNFYVGLGGEIGYDASNGFPNSIPVSNKPFTGAVGPRNEQSITDAQSGGVKYVRENSSGAYWWGMSWLGELYPDSAWDRWAASGNLPTGNGPGTFSRVLRSSINTGLPVGTTFFNAVRRTSEEGSTTFFWNGSATSTFHHRYADNTSGSLSADGRDVRDNYALPLPDSISNNRPFGTGINDAGMNPNHFLQPVYGAPTTLSSLAEFYRHQSGVHGSALIAMRDTASAAFIVVNGLSPAGQSGTAFIARWSFLSLIHSFLAAGRSTTGGLPDPSRVRQLPRVVITSPNEATSIDDPATLRITWSSAWRRWDGLPYTPAYPATFADDTPVRFAVLYSRDNGRTWLHVQDDSRATPGERPAAAYLTTATSYDWSVPASSFPMGNYLLRVEAYRDGIALHYSFHQFRAFFRRS